MIRTLLVCGLILVWSHRLFAQMFDYHLPARVYPEVLSDRKIEIWGRIYAPMASLSGRWPLIVILHGNHPTCGRGSEPRIDDNCRYTMEQVCDDDYVVVPNHLGYEYLANRLTQQGFMVVSINANLGINCGPSAPGDPGLNLARGKLILLHLSKLVGWDRGEGYEKDAIRFVRDRIDFTRVGLIGHSRGGEGVRAAYNYYRDPKQNWQKIIGPMKVRAMFEVGPVDGQSPVVLNPDGLPWATLLPACDGDVADLQGIRVFDRMSTINQEANRTPKSALLLWGMNHNFFNTQWQRSDSKGCSDHAALFPSEMGSASQREALIQTVVPFMNAFLPAGADPAWARFIDPLNALPSNLARVTTVDRSYCPWAGSQFTLPVDNLWRDFDSTLPLILSNVTQSGKVFAEHSGVVGSRLSWTNAGPQTYAQFNWATEEETLDYPSQGYVEFRVSRQFRTALDAVDFSIRLVGNNDQLSNAVTLSSFATVKSPANGHALLQTVRIPVQRFTGLEKVRGIKFIFDKTANGQVNVSNLVFRTPQSATLASRSHVAPAPERLPTQSRTVYRANLIRRSDILTFESTNLFLAKNSLLVLSVGNSVFTQSAYEKNGRLDRIRFTVSPDELATLRTGQKVRLYYASNPDGEMWDAGTWRP